MPRVEFVRAEVQHMVSAHPFHPFALLMENGDRIVIEHSENIAFDPGQNGAGSEDFYVISKQLRQYSTFGAVTKVALVDLGRTG